MPREVQKLLTLRMNRFSLHMTRPEPPDTHIGAVQVDAVATEPVLLEAFVEAVRCLDPDILLGYDVRKVGISTEVAAGNLRWRHQCLPVVAGTSPHTGQIPNGCLLHRIPTIGTTQQLRHDS